MGVGTQRATSIRCVAICKTKIPYGTEFIILRPTRDKIMVRRHIRRRNFKEFKGAFMRCVALRCVALRCVALRCVALRCVALRCVALRS